MLHDDHYSLGAITCHLQHALQESDTIVECYEIMQLSNQVVSPLVIEVTFPADIDPRHGNSDESVEFRTDESDFRLFGFRLLSDTINNLIYSDQMFSLSNTSDIRLNRISVESDFG